MRYKLGHKEESRLRILAAAGRGFRKKGYGGIGVDGLAHEAGVTSGAFYGHFPSKSEAFREAVVKGLRDLCASIGSLQSAEGDAWIEAFIDRYLGKKRTCDLSEACVFQALTPEVVRAESAVRRAYQEEIVKVIDVVAKGLAGGTLAERRARAWALLAMLAGAVTAARAIEDDALASKVARSVRGAALLVART